MGDIHLSDVDSDRTAQKPKPDVQQKFRSGIISGETTISRWPEACTVTILGRMAQDKHRPEFIHTSPSL
ncbi:hypothetical protein FKM82_004398 [Ascaphus truei]